MATRTISICDICGSETDNSKEYWHTQTVRVNVVCPSDGVNGGDFSGEWCHVCRIKLGNFINELKAKTEAADNGRD